MKNKPHSALGHYRSVDAYGAAAAEDRNELVLKMMVGAQDRLASARGHMSRHETAAKGEAINKAIGLIDGLRTSLDHEHGGEIAGNLDALYDYMTRRLVEANASDNPGAIDEVSRLLGEIRSAWEQITAAAVQPA